MAITRQNILAAARWIQRVALLRGQKQANGSLGKGWASYTEFCMQFKLGSPYHNALMDRLLLGVMKECEQNGWPDLPALVIHDDQMPPNEGPGAGWYEGHGLLPGDLRKWRQYRDDCWARASSFSI